MTGPNRFVRSQVFLTFFLFAVIAPANVTEQLKILLPVLSNTRSSVNELHLTEIGHFGRMRVARPGIPAHHHTGIDIQRPALNYYDEPIFAISIGTVISIRDDGAFAQIIIEHKYSSGELFWSVYEHISDISINLNDNVDSEVRIARFMNREELNRFGWQFDHFHLEILRVAPVKLKPTTDHPRRQYATYALSCYDLQDLDQYYFDPIFFFQKHFSTH